MSHIFDGLYYMMVRINTRQIEFVRYLGAYRLEVMVRISVSFWSNGTDWHKYRICPADFVSFLKRVFFKLQYN